MDVVLTASTGSVSLCCQVVRYLIAAVEIALGLQALANRQFSTVGLYALGLGANRLSAYQGLSVPRMDRPPRLLYWLPGLVVIVFLLRRALWQRHVSSWLGRAVRVVLLPVLAAAVMCMCCLFIAMCVCIDLPLSIR